MANPDLQLAADLVELLIARALRMPDRIASLLANLEGNREFRDSPLWGYALRFSETINEFPQSTTDLLSSCDAFARAGLAKSRAYSELAAAMHLAREGASQRALGLVTQAAERLSGEVRDEHMILNNRAAVGMLQPDPDFANCVLLLSAGLLTSRDDFSDVTLLNNLAIAYWKNGQLEDALDCMQRIFTILDAPSFADKDIYWTVTFTAMQIFKDAGKLDDSERVKSNLLESIPKPFLYSSYWEYRFGLSNHIDGKFSFLLAFDYHPMYLSHWLIDQEGLHVLRQAPPQ